MAKPAGDVRRFFLGLKPVASLKEHLAGTEFDHDQSEHGGGGGKGLHPAIAKLHPSKAVVQMVELRQSREYGVTDAFARDRGFKNVQEFRAAVDKHLASLTDTVDVAIAMPPDNLRQVLESGQVLNAYQTGTTGAAATGGLSYYTDARREGEHLFWGIPEDAPDGRHPIYGYARDKTTGGEENEWIDQYGTADVVLNDDVKERSTLTFGDSLDSGVIHNMAGMYPSPLLQPSSYSLWGFDLTDSKHYPLNYETLAARPSSISGYTEVQIHGGVSVDDIKHVYLPPDADLVELRGMLDAAGIPWSEQSI